MDIHNACKTRRLSYIKSAVVSEEINVTDPVIGWTPLFRSVVSGHLEGVLCLLDHGADPNIKNTDEETPLHSAAENSQLDIVQVLLMKGADPNSRQKLGETPLHLAAIDGNPQITALLLKFNANPNLQSSLKNRTPLHYAVSYGHTDCALMIAAQANVEMKDSDGNTPLDLCEDSELRRILHEGTNDSFFELLKSHKVENLHSILLTNKIRNIDELRELSFQKLEDIGVAKPGDRRKLQMMLSCDNDRNALSCYCFEKERDKYRPIPCLEEWLEQMNLTILLDKFEESGFDDYEFLLKMMNSHCKITHKILEEEVHISDYRFRSLIIDRLENDSKQYFRATDIEKNYPCHQCVLI